MTSRSLLLGAAFALVAVPAAADWPQWRGPNRDAKATGFTAPATWPKELTKKWRVTVGDGVGTPALVGDKLYVFTRVGGDEVTRCLDAATGNEVWQDKNNVAFKSKGGDNGFPGPRASPTVADGKVVTLGVNGTLSCLDAATGKVAWRKDDYKDSFPTFHTSSSPVVVDGLAVAQLGGKQGAVVAYDLATGAERWKWTGGGGTSYASPVVMTVGGTKAIVAETDENIVALSPAGALLGQIPYPLPPRGSGRGGLSYNASTPMVDGDTLIYAGSNRGTKAVKVEKAGDKLTTKELWSNPDNSVQFNTPVVRGDLVFGLSARNDLFCIDTKSGKTLWSAPVGKQATGRGGTGYGSIVDAGAVLFALTPAGELVVFEPSDKDFKPLARYKVADGQTYAYPVIAGKGVYIKDKDAVTLWAFE
jgi:outer membrane protein assembly factor BamB